MTATMEEKQTKTGRKSPVTRIISWDELESHKSVDSCWICFEGNAYDVTEWIQSHPGGRATILNVGGRDCTDLVKQFHVLSSYSGRIKKMLVGQMAKKDPKLKMKGNTAFAEECRELTKTLEKTGWYKPDADYFIRKTIQGFGILFVAIAIFLKGYYDQQVWMQYVGGFLVGFFWQQTNFLGHDAGHGSVILNKSMNNWFGLLVGNISSGLSIAWWKHTHYTHHVVTNVYTHDPDIQHLPVFAVDNRFFQKFHSIYWDHTIKFDKLSQFFVSFQHLLFYPIMTISRALLHVQSIIHVLTHENCPNRFREFCGLMVFWSWWLTLCSMLPSWSSLAVFYYVTSVGVSLIHVQICLSHFCMEVFNAVPYEKQDESYFEFQLRTSMDIDCPEWLDWLHGGLQYQVVHHLFPRVPRHRLRALSKIVQTLCDKHGVTYHHCGFFEANRKTLSHMADIASQARNGKFVKFEDTLTFHGMNLVG